MRLITHICVSKPQSFKQLLKLKSIPTAVSAPLPVQGGLVLTPEFIVEQQHLKQEMLSFVNQLRCPICQSQLDGEVNGRKASLYCCQSISEYSAEYSENKTLTYCCLRLGYGERGYLIPCRSIGESLFAIEIHQLDLTLNLIYQEKYRQKLFSYSGPVPNLDFPLEEEDLLSQLKLSAVFS